MPRERRCCIVNHLMPRRKTVKSAVIKQSPPVLSNVVPRRISYRNAILLVILILVALLWKFRSNFIVAMVNGQPISRFQLNDKLVKKFGDQTLDSIINERLILAASRQKGIFIKSEEIDARTKQIEQRLNGKISLDDALKAQGLNRDDFRQELEIQLSIEKMFDKEATLSSVEIDDYINKNSQAYKNATDPAQVRADAQNILKQQKINDLFETWFNDIRKNAKITKFL